MDECGLSVEMNRVSAADSGHCVTSAGRSFGRWSCLCSLTPRASGNHAELQDPTSPEGQDDDRAQNHCEQQCYGQRQLTMENQEVQLDALQVLEDEDEDLQQGHYAD